jgi:hypothetical protein
MPALRRREFITLLCGATATWPLAGTIRDRSRRSSRPSTRSCADWGFVEGQNLIVDSRGYAAQVDVILAGGAAAARTRSSPVAPTASVFCTSAATAGNCSMRSRAAQAATRNDPYPHFDR